MKIYHIKLVLGFLAFSFISIAQSQININKLSNKIKNEIPIKKSENSNSLSNDEVIKGLKEALSIGIEKSTEKASAIGGFLKNDLIRIPFPPEAKSVRDKAMQWGLDNKVEKFEQTLNEAAEEACKTAAPIFINAVKNMSVGDGFKILKGNDVAATNYLKNKTSSELYNLFIPEVKKAIEKVSLTAYWDPLVKKYNQTTLISGKEKIETDLNKYVTERAIDGLFKLVEIQEKEIRKNPLKRTSDILKKVFNSLDP
ncbi:MAG: hypothetical protein CND37_02210 [Bacteroidetes bacterium MED-G20]|nr:MAG: hypothetical protein CND37_02210 [Bacteroidetes bacterium MED-G20]